ncbi:MAG: hypothetical protein GY792_18110 [Gammaproteobacteria bacterium]|nr:hypothetical protein [Gammaproteobacteria bacterium]
MTKKKSTGDEAWARLQYERDKRSSHAGLANAARGGDVVDGYQNPLIVGERSRSDRLVENGCC